MILVAPTISSATESDAGRSPNLQDWALTRGPIEEHLRAIEFVLIHDFDEPLARPGSRPSRDAAQRDRERFLIEATGLASERDRQAITFIGSAPTESQSHGRIAA